MLSQKAAPAFFPVAGAVSHSDAGKPLRAATRSAVMVLRLRRLMRNESPSLDASTCVAPRVRPSSAAVRCAAVRHRHHEVQASIERNTVKYVKLQRADNVALNASLQTALEKRGMMFNQADTASFRPPLGDFYRRWKEHFGAKAWDALEGHVGKLGA